MISKLKDLSIITFNLATSALFITTGFYMVVWAVTVLSNWPLE